MNTHQFAHRHSAIRRSRQAALGLLLTSLLASKLLVACSATGSITTPIPSASATAVATATPSPQPTAMPTPEPTAMPTPEPEPTAIPTPPNKVLTLYGLTSPNKLLRFNSNAPSTTTLIDVTGLPAGQFLVGIDFRPSDNKLYGSTQGGRLVTIDTTTGAATVVNAVAFSPALSTPVLGFDFNPELDRIRIQGNTGQNLRLNPVTGNVAASDTVLSYADGDLNAGATPGLAGSAYTHSGAEGDAIKLYAIDQSRDILVQLNNANSGALTTLGALNVNTNEYTGFDIAPDGRAYAALLPSGSSSSALYSVDLTNGASTLIENIGSGQKIFGLTIAP
ncbi:MAG: hypothetical protein CVV27_01725 [Candidatus Melainabacteria bacterium HGW-Melainabacteria-1]|nr:MAG: hypothetical protein CVV27_01725 [Candidatus Melainabacteria bacterium HGW-Melainabacteria-1]